MSAERGGGRGWLREDGCGRRGETGRGREIRPVRHQTRIELQSGRRCLESRDEGKVRICQQRREHGRRRELPAMVAGMSAQKVGQINRLGRCREWHGDEDDVPDRAKSCQPRAHVRQISIHETDSKTDARQYAAAVSHLMAHASPGKPSRMDSTAPLPRAGREETFMLPAVRRGDLFVAFSIPRPSPSPRMLSAALRPTGGSSHADAGPGTAMATFM